MDLPPSNRNGVVNLMALAEKRRAVTSKARELAAKGKSAKTISRQLGVSLTHARSIVTAYRRTLLPILENGLLELNGAVYGSTVGIAQIMGYSDTRIRRIVADFQIEGIKALSKGRIRQAYPVESVKKGFSKSPSYFGPLEPYRFLSEELREAKSGDLTSEEILALLTIIRFMRENMGEAPHYVEIAQLTGLNPYRPKAIVPSLIKKGYLSQIKRRVAKRLQPQVRYVIHKAPALAVTRPAHCANCSETVRIKFDWYLPQNGHGTAL